MLPTELKLLPFVDEQYKVQGSIGKGNWATIPWIAFLDKRITETTQSGEYIVLDHKQYVDLGSVIEIRNI